MTIRRSRLVYPLLVCTLLAAAIGLRYADPFFVRALRLIAFDSYQRLDPASYDPNLPIRIVDIDEDSLARIGQWPWPRTTVRDILVELASRQAAAIAFDFLFIEPDRLSLEQIVRLLPPQQAELLASAANSQPTNDQSFAEALRATPSVLAVAPLDSAGTPLKPKAGFAVAGDDPAPFVARFPGVSSNLPLLDAAARGYGVISWIPDRDQVVRRAALIYRVQNSFVPSLSIEALRVAQGASTYLLKSSNASGETAFGQATGLNHIRVGEFELPTDSAGGMFLKFRYYQKDSYIPAWKLLAGQIPAEEIAGKIILIGTSASGLYDLRATPLDASLPGVEIHAQLLEQMLTGRFLSRPDYSLAVEEFVILIAGLMLAFILPRVSARSSAAIGALTVLIVVIVGWASFKYAGLLFDAAYPSLAIGCAAVAITSYVYQNVETQRKEMQGAFGRYLAPAVVQELIAHPERLTLGGEVRDLTLMFCDVRNFTGISQYLTAIELTHFINELLSPLSEIILEHRGTIDKYMGDAIMAFWNAPLDDPEHAANACRSALKMIAKMDDLNAKWQERAQTSGREFRRVNIGIGINTGQCCVGNLGSTIRFDYSAIGDDVNVTSRLEGLSKVYGVSNVVAETALHNGHDFPALELDMVQVQGRTRPTRIYTFLQPLRAGLPETERLRDQHGKFLAAYRSQKWEDAEAMVGECRAIGVSSLDACYRMFLSRIGVLRQATLPANWDGTYAMTEK